MSKDSRQLATSLFKALDILTLISSRSDGLTIQELVDGMDLPRTSLLRLLDSLSHYGLVGRDSLRRYYVTDSFREWRRDDANERLTQQYRPMMRRLSDALGEMVTLGKASGRGIRHLHCEEPDRRVRVVPPVGRRFSLEKMAMGKLLLCVRPDLLPKKPSADYMAELETVRKNGYAFNMGESEEGIVAIALWLGEPAPLTPMLAITWPDFRFAEDECEKAMDLLRKESKQSGPFSAFLENE